MLKAKELLKNRVFLSLEEAAMYIGLSTKTFRRKYYEDEGANGRFFMIGRKMFVTKKDLLKWEKEYKG